jgi:hypothetical protein
MGIDHVDEVSSPVEDFSIHTDQIRAQDEREKKDQVPAHMTAPHLANRADDHFQQSIQNVMKISQQSNMLITELLPVITRLNKEKAKFDELSDNDETVDLSSFQADMDRIKAIYKELKAQGYSLNELAATSSDNTIDQGDAKSYLDKIFPEDLDLEEVDRWQFEELKENLSNWRETLKRDIDFNTNSLFAVLQLYISCQNVMQNMMRNEIESNKKRTDNQIAR